MTSHQTSAATLVLLGLLLVCGHCEATFGAASLFFPQLFLQQHHQQQFQLQPNHDDNHNVPVGPPVQQQVDKTIVSSSPDTNTVTDSVQPPATTKSALLTSSDPNTNTDRVQSLAVQSTPSQTKHTLFSSSASAHFQAPDHFQTPNYLQTPALFQPAVSAPTTFQLLRNPLWPFFRPMGYRSLGYSAMPLQHARMSWPSFGRRAFVRAANVQRNHNSVHHVHHFHGVDSNVNHVHANLPSRFQPQIQEPLTQVHEEAQAVPVSTISHPPEFYGQPNRASQVPGEPVTVVTKDVQQQQA